MHHEPLDLSPLDPTIDGPRFERLVAETLEYARPELARRASPPSAWRTLVRWSRPTLAAAGLAAVASAAVLGGVGVPARNGAAAFTTPDAMSLSALLDDWLIEGRLPTANEIVIAFEGDLP
jgi:hypothetical protein